MLYIHLAICLVLSIPLNAQNIVIDDSSPSWSYTPPVCPDVCDGGEAGIQQSWWQLANQRNSSAMEGFFNLTETATNLIGATASLNFKGIAIYYYGNVAPWGGVMAVTVDGNTTNVNTTNSGPEQRQSLVYSRTGLDGSQQHTLTVKMIGGTFIDVDRVDITPPPTSTSSSSSIISTSTSTGVTPSVSATTGQSTGKSPNVEVLVGSIIAAVVILGLCILLGTLWIPRRRSRNTQLSTIFPWSTAARRTLTLPSQPEARQSSIHFATSLSTSQPNHTTVGDRNGSPEPPPYVLYEDLSS